MTWQEIARRLPNGGSTRIQHCGSDRSLKLNRQGNKVSAYCFRCGLSEFQYEQATLADMVARREAEAAILQQRTPTLPSDYTQNIPQAGRLWLYKASITEDTWRAHSMGWSPKLSRVIIPVYSGGTFKGCIMRAVEKDHKPKYISNYAGGSTYVVGTLNGDGQLVVVEDALSAIRIAKYTQSMATLTTQIPITALLSSIIATGAKQILCWFDGDRAGKHAWERLHKSIAMLPYVEVHKISTSKDPKAYSNREILLALEGGKLD